MKLFLVALFLPTTVVADDWDSLDCAIARDFVAAAIELQNEYQTVVEDIRALNQVASQYKNRKPLDDLGNQMLKRHREAQLNREKHQLMHHLIQSRC